MDLLIKGGERERGEGRGGGGGGFYYPTLFCCILSPFISLRYKEPEYLEHAAVILFRSALLYTYPRGTGSGHPLARFEGGGGECGTFPPAKDWV